MNVEIINPEAVRDLYKNHGMFACTCYNTPEKYAEKVGQTCSKNNHYSGSRCEYIKFKITNLDRGTSEQALRHEIGTDIPFEYQDNYSFFDYSQSIINVPADEIVKNMASFRYIDKSGFKWEVPKAIKQIPAARLMYDELMEQINATRTKILDTLTKNGVASNVANEAVNFVLPRATTTDFVIGFTPEALINFCHKRLCSRAQEFINQLAKLMKSEIAKYNPVFAEELVPYCEHYLWCPEGKASCGRKPTRDELIITLKK